MKIHSAHHLTCRVALSDPRMVMAAMENSHVIAREVAKKLWRWFIERGGGKDTWKK